MTTKDHTAKAYTVPLYEDGHCNLQTGEIIFWQSYREGYVRIYLPWAKRFITMKKEDIEKALKFIE